MTDYSYRMHLIFFDDPQTRASLKPFTLTRPVADLRVGILTIAGKWPYYLSKDRSLVTSGFLTEKYLSEKFKLSLQADNLLIDGAICPNAPLAAAIQQLPADSVLKHDQKIIAIRMNHDQLQNMADRLHGSSFALLTDILQEQTARFASVTYQATCTQIRHNWDIFQQNGQQIEADFAQITSGRTSAGIQDPHTIVYRPENVFVEEGASLRAAVINAEGGPVYIGKNAAVQENAVVTGPFAILDSARVNIGSKIREATTIGPYCSVGGEVKNSVFYANSNKSHEGYIGNAVVGEWCNFGADTNCSNLKNNYKNVHIYDYGHKDYVSTGDIFCGLMMGDHSKCGINTMFNTGTVVGVSCNIFGADFPPKFIPSFTWGGIRQAQVYQLDKALEVAKNVLKRRKINLKAEDAAILSYIFENIAYEK